MTQYEWQRCATPEIMLQWLQKQGKLSARKARLFAVACSRSIWRLLPHEESRKNVEAAEKYADGLVSQRDLKVRQKANKEALWEAGWGINWNCPAWLVRADREVAMPVVHDCIDLISLAAAAANAAGLEAAVTKLQSKNIHIWKAAVRTATQVEESNQCGLLRDIFGNPFRSFAFDASWRTPPVISLAQQAYDGAAFDRLPELATLLEAAGCRDASLLLHLTESRPHVKGCAAVDAVLGKS